MEVAAGAEALGIYIRLLSFHKRTRKIRGSCISWSQRSRVRLKSHLVKGSNLSKWFFFSQVFEGWPEEVLSQFFVCKGVRSVAF